MGAKNTSAKIAQRETCPSIKNRPQAMGQGARILLGSVRLGPAERSGCLCWKQVADLTYYIFLPRIKPAEIQ